MPTLGQKPPQGKKEVIDPEAAIHRVRWSCAQASNPDATWIASGGQPGLVRCQRVSV